MDALGFGLGKKFGEGAQGLRVRVSDGDGLAFFAGIFGGEIQMVPDGAVFLNIIEERNVAEGARYAGGLGCVISDRGGGGAAVNEEKIVSAKKRHEPGHEPRIGSGERALMIVDARGVGHAGQHGIQLRRDFSGRHAGAKFLGFAGFVSERFHGEMEHDLVAAAMSLLGNLRGAGMIGKNGEGQGIMQSENGVNSSGVGGDIVKNDNEARSRNSGARRMRGRTGFGSTVRMKERIDRRFDFAATTEGHR